MKALKKKLNAYKIKVSIEPNCILKAARAFLVFKNLEGHGDIIKSQPSVQDIEDEKFDLDFSIVIVTEDSFEAITTIIKNVSEIADATGVAITTPFPETAEKETEEKEEKKESKVSAQKNKESKPAAASSQHKAPAAKPHAKAVGRSVRVDIEKLDVLMNLVSEPDYCKKWSCICKYFRRKCKFKSEP